MKAKTNLSLFVLIFVCLLTFNCKESTTEEKAVPQEEENVYKEDVMSDLDPALDPLVVGKEFSKVLSDTLNVQMYEFTMQPGDSVGLHQHLDHTVYILEGGRLMLYINGTEQVEMELKTGVGFVAGPLTDAAKNIGDSSVKLLLTEIHRPRE